MAVSVEESVLLTVAYTAQFDFPLKTDEIFQRLVINKINKSRLEAALKFLSQKKLIIKNDGYWQLATQSTDLQLRLAREKLSLAKMTEVKELKELIGWIPWVKGIAITGSLAMNNAQSRSDIDFMVVSQSGRLWMTRLLVLLIIWVVGKRRTRHGNEDNSWCFNLWLDSNSLRLPSVKQTLYSAHEVYQALWVLDKDNLQQDFYQQNNWVEEFLPNYYQALFTKKEYKQKKDLNKIISITLWMWAKLLDLINLIIYFLQFLYMYPHITRERVALGYAYFHPRSTQGLIYQRWYNSLLALWKK